MNKIFSRAKLIFLGIFAVAVIAIWAYQYFYVWPAQRCEAAGRWWAAEYRYCGVPVKISTLTGRPDPVAAPSGGKTAPGAAAPVAAPTAPAAAGPAPAVR